MSKYLILFVIGILICGCSHPNKPEEKPVEKPPKNPLGIYFLKDSTITAEHFKLDKIPLDSFVLQDKPWISEDMIDYYDFSSHCIYLKLEKSQFFPYWDIFIAKPYWYGKPFFFVINNRIIYYGYFTEILSHSPYSSDTIPSIEFTDSAMYPKDILHISFFKNIIKNDNINKIVKDVLIGNDKYKAGLFVEIGDIKINKIQNGEDTEIECKLTIKNNNSDNLYVLDPDKAGEGYFNGYNVGLEFGNPISRRIYSAKNRLIYKTETWDFFSINWFTLLGSGQSITRNVKLNGYGIIPNGKYECYMYYTGPIYGNEKNKRILSNGKIWIGPTLSNIVTLDIKN